MDLTTRSRKLIRWVQKQGYIALHAVGVIRHCSVIYVLPIGWQLCLRTKHWYIGFRVVCGEMPANTADTCTEGRIMGTGCQTGTCKFTRARSTLLCGTDDVTLEFQKVQTDHFFLHIITFQRSLNARTVICSRRGTRA